MALEIGVFLPTTVPASEQPVVGEVRASARFAEEIGLDSVWSTDHLVATSPMLDSTVVLATAASVTDRIAIGFGVMLLALRPVAWAAKQISTLQHVSGDRLVLGVGTGNPAHGDVGWRAAGTSFEDRGPRTDEALRVLPGLVTGRTTTLADGLEVTLAPGATMPPVLVAGNGKKALARAAAHGDGWASIGLSPAEVAVELAVLDGLAAQYGRPTPKATVVGPALDADPGKAAARLSEYAAAGTERVILAPNGPDWRWDYEFAARVRAEL